ncbi:MAG: HEPN domain-containing protein [Candidatus Wallbacteria bacterium]|nr:HEPN domain-containing protein [Candidatus Wallbacteria bacterium]
MTDLAILTGYRINQAVETLDEAKKMQSGGFSTRTIVNRAYYAVFYALLALHIGSGKQLKTSKHAGVISSFDREFVKSGIFHRRLSEMVHKLFDLRQEADYHEMSEISREKAAEAVGMADDVILGIQGHLGSQGI